MTKTNLSFHLSVLGIILALHAPPIAVAIYACGVLATQIPDGPEP
jgi:hypothetical protein